MLLPVVACEDDSTTVCADCSSASTWTQLAGGLGETHFAAVWANAADTVLALGMDHPVYRFDGENWSLQTPPPDESGLVALWGSSPRNLFAVGVNNLAMHFDGSAWNQLDPGFVGDFTDMWGLSPNELLVSMAEPAGGRVLHMVGSTWSELTGSFMTVPRTVWASGLRNVLTAGDQGFAARHDGQGWNIVHPASDSFAWLDSWGTATTAFFVGENGHVAKYAASVFVEGASPTGEALRSVCGFSVGDVWAVGDAGTIVHYDGTSWSLVESGTTSPLYAIAGFQGGAIALGDHGTVLVFDGTNWSLVLDGRAVVYHDMIGFSTNDVFAVGRQGGSNGFIRHFDGREWILPGDELMSVWGFAPDDVFAAGRLGAVHHYDGASWNLIDSGTFSNLSGVGGAESEEARRVYIVGQRATIRVWSGSTFSPMLPPPNYFDDLRDVWAAAPDNVFAVGPTGAILRFKGPLNAIAWTTEETGLAAAGFNAITGRSADDVVAVSTDGHIFHYDGSAWHEQPGDEATALLDVSLAKHKGVVVAAPSSLLLLDGATRSRIVIPFLGAIETAWTARNGTAYAAGGQGAWFEYGR